MEPKQKKLIIIVGAVVGIALVVGLAIFFGKGSIYKGCLIDGFLCDPDPLPPYVPPPASAKLGGYAKPDRVGAGVKGSFSIDFTTTKAIPYGGSIRVMFPAGFDANDAKFYNCELAGSFGFDKTTFEMTVKNVLATPANTRIVCHFLDVKNPSDPGIYEGFSLRTFKISNTSDPTEILDWFDSPAVTIEPTYSTNPNFPEEFDGPNFVRPQSLGADVKTMVKVRFTTTKPIPDSGKLEVTFPAGFDANAGTLKACNIAEKPNHFEVTKKKNEIKVGNLYPTPAGTHIVCYFNEIQNPHDQKPTGEFMLASKAANDTPVDDYDLHVAPVTITAPSVADFIAEGAVQSNTNSFLPELAKKGTTSPTPTPTSTGIGKLKNVSITSTPPDTLVAGTQPSLTVKLTPSVLPSELPIFGRIFVRFPKEFDLTNPITVDCNINGGLLATGIPTSTTGDNTVMISRTGSTPTSTSTTQLSAEIVCHLKGIKLPTKDGSYSNFYVATNNGANITIDETTDVPAVVVLPGTGTPTPGTPPPPPKVTTGTLNNTSITPASFPPNVPTDLMIKFTTSTPVPVNSKVVISFPASFNVASATVKGCNPTGVFTGPLFVEAAKNTVSIFEIPDLGKMPTPTEVTCLLGGITGAVASPTKLYVTVATQDIFSQVLDTNSNVGPLTIETPPLPNPDNPKANPPAPPAVPQNPTLKPAANNPPAPAPNQNQNRTPSPAATQNPPTPSVSPTTPAASASPSKCPGVNYPNDIPAGHWAQDVIQQAYDRCIFSGYEGGGFQPNAQISKAEGLKAILAAAGIKGKETCDMAECNTLFTDLVPWQKPWVFAAWERKIIEAAKLFMPQRPMTRGEVVLMVVKAFGLDPHKGCYTANCGAGYPNNMFNDIHQEALGPYLRTASDMHIIQGKFPNKFDPDGPITRAEIAKIIIKAIQVTRK